MAMKNPMVTVNLSAAQFEAWKVATQGQKQSAILRGLMRQFVEAQGLEWPDDLAAPGGWQGNEKSLENLLHYVDKLTDTGRNEP